ncbi:MerR family transcriptional regulator [Streptomyces sp. HC307]|uniref:MerR family transcriptional regulator n=1 Tax=Streptomyces flavusporus TaxID=3385496 RepID=UPI003916F0AE
MALQGMTIGQAAQAAGLTRKAVRVYESKSLLPAADRSTAGYRLYTSADVELLTFIRARTLGLHLDDVREVLEIHRGGTPPCNAVRDLLDARIAEIDTTVKELLTLRQTLAETRKAADDRPCTDSSPYRPAGRPRPGPRPRTAT